MDRHFQVLPPKSPEMVEVSGALEVTCADGTMTLADFYDVAKEDEKLKIACPFSDSSTVGAAWLVRGKTCVFLYCSSDHHGHDHRSEGVARWIYRAQVVFERGDEVEIADRLIKDYLGETAVFDQGAPIPLSRRWNLESLRKQRSRIHG